MEFKKLRHEMGLTVAQVSRLYEIPYSTLQKWEYELSEPPAYVLKMMRELYEFRIKDLENVLS